MGRIFSLFCAAIIALSLVCILISCSEKGKGEDGKSANPPAKPQGLAAEASNSNEITLSWIRDTAVRYRIFFQRHGDAQWDIVEDAREFDGNEKVIGGLLASTRYNFRLAAINNHGLSDQSDVVSEKTLISSPANLRATVLPNNALTVEWDRVIDNEEERNLRSTGGGGNQSAVKYRVYLSQNQNNFNLENEVGETQIILANLNNTASHYIKVSAIDTEGREGAASDFIWVNLYGDLPPAPMGLTANLQVDSRDNGIISARLQWNLVNGATEYRVYYSTQPNVAYELYAPMRDNLMTVIGLRQGMQYFFRVSAVNSVGEGARSSERSLQTPQPGPPNTPTGLTAQWESGTKIVELTWNGISNATGYYIFTAQSQSGPFSRQEWAIDGRTRTRIDYSLWPSNQTVFFRVSAFNAQGESPLSAVVSGTSLR